VSAVLFAILTLLVLFWYASPGLRLFAGRARRIVSMPRRAVAGAVISVVALFGTARASALQDRVAVTHSVDHNVFPQITHGGAK